MTESQASNKLPVIAAIVAVALLAAIAGYLFIGKGATGTAISSDKAAAAAAEAESAIGKSGMSASERKAVESVVRAYILEHPEVITDAVEILQQRDTARRLDAAGAALTKAFPGAETGNVNGDVTLVEFTDYSCGYCRASVADVNKLLGEDKNLRVVYRELPILAPISREAALWGLAAAKQGKHKAFHDAMFAEGHPSDASIRAAAAKAGMDVAAAATFAKSDEAATEVDGNLAMMQQIGFNGTPTFVVGGQLLEGAVGYDALKAAIEKARTKA